MNNIFVRIDFQNDFVHPHGALSINNPELIEKHQQFADSLFPNCFDKIIETYDTHFAETYANTFEAQSFPPHCIFGTWGWQQAAPFKPDLEVTKMYKSTTNLWNEIKNYRELNDDWNNTNVYLCGLLSDICVQQAMNGFLKRGAKVILIDDLCQGAEKQISDILLILRQRDPKVRLDRSRNLLFYKGYVINVGAEGGYKMLSHYIDYIFARDFIGAGRAVEKFKHFFPMMNMGNYFKVYEDWLRNGGNVCG